LVVGSPAYAIKYYKSAGGVATAIDAAGFDGCGNIIYRKSASKELTKKHKKSYLKASLKAKTVNDLDAAKKKLVASDGSCTYGSDSETF